VLKYSQEKNWDEKLIWLSSEKKNQAYSLSIHLANGVSQSVSQLIRQAEFKINFKIL